MKSVFSAGVLEDIGSSDVLLAFDYDGTLAPIVDDPAHAQMRGKTRRLLAETARVYPCAVVSGRAEESVLRLLAGVTVWYVIGNRALQPPSELDRLAAEVSRWRPLLTEALGAIAGVEIEDKTVSIAIHYRRAADRGRAQQAIEEAVERLGAARVLFGNEVVNVLPQGAAGKANAVDQLRSRLGTRQTLYVGDDRTDEDVFALSGVTGVRIGPPTLLSRARYCLPDQAAIDDLLAELIALRPRSEPRPESPLWPVPRKHDLG